LCITSDENPAKAARRIISQYKDGVINNINNPFFLCNMEYKTETITERLNTIIEKYLSRDSTGKPIEEIGYLRRGIWGKESSSSIEWMLAAEVPPAYESTTWLDFYYVPNDIDIRKLGGQPGSFIRTSGFYIGDRKVSADLEEALAKFEEDLIGLKRKIRR
jgi:hypothetical protein